MTELVSIAWKKNNRDLAPLTYCLDALIQLAVDQQASAHEKVIDAASYRDLNHLVEFGQPHFIRIDQDGHFFLSELPGFEEFRVDVIPTGFHRVNIRNSLSLRLILITSTAQSICIFTIFVICNGNLQGLRN